MHVMLDLETLGTRPDAAIVQIGAVLFEPVSGGKILNGKAFNRYVGIQKGAGTIDHDTICFWLQEKTAAELGKSLMVEAVFLEDALKSFTQWPSEAHGISWGCIEGVWGNGGDFDVPILRSAFARFGKDAPWHYRAPRCVRTLFDLVGGPPEIDWAGMTKHDALDDAIGQAMQVQKAMGALGRNRR